MTQPSQQPDLTGLTRRFAEHAANLQFDALPREVFDKIKLILRDGVGNQIAASAISEPALLLARRDRVSQS